MKTFVKGFTLMQLCITLLLLSTLSMLGWSHWHPIYENQLTQAQAKTLYHDILFAKHTAMTKHQSVILCPTNDESTCAQKWGPKYMIAVSSDETLIPLKICTLSKVDVSLASSFNQSQLMFSPQGTLNTQGSFNVHTKNHSYRVVFLHSARVSMIPA